MKVIELNKPQSELVLDEESKAIAFVSGLGGGKSFSACVKLVHLKLKYPDHNILYLVPIFSMFRDILLPTLAEVIDKTEDQEGSEIQYKANKTTGEIFFKDAGRVIVKSMDSVESIIGFNVLFVILDELDTLSKDNAILVWQKAIARARRRAQKVDHNGNKVFDEDGNVVYMINQIISVSSPEGYKALYELFVKNKPENYRLIQASGRLNKHLPSDYYDNMEALYPQNLIKAYIDGEFISLGQGRVYTEYNRDKCDTDAVYRNGETLHISIDFNVKNVNGVVYVEREPILTKLPDYAYNETPTLHAIHHFKGIDDTPELIEVIRNKFPTSPIYCYPDASGRNTSTKGITVSDISLLKKAGFHVKAFSKNKRVLDRVQSMNSALKCGLVKISVNFCMDVVEALEQQLYNPNTELPDKKASNAIDDINDAATYIAIFKLPIVRRSAQKRRLRGL